MLKKFVSIAMVLMLVLSLAACQSKTAEAPKDGQGKTQEPAAPAKQGTSLDKIKQAGKLVMGTSADFPPFESIDPKDGKTVIGFDIDIAQKVADKIGVKLEVKDTKFDGLIAALTAGNINMIAAGMNPTEERKKSVDFSDSYYKNVQALIVREGDDSIKTAADMKGKKFGAQLGSTSEEAAKLVEGIELKTLDKVDQLCLQTKNKNIDGVIVEQTVAQAYVKSMGGLKIITIPELNDGTGDVCIAVPKGDTELLKVINEVIGELKSSGEYDKLIDKWFVTK